MVEIKQEYGTYHVLENQKEVYKTNSLDELNAFMDERVGNYEEETVEITTYVSCEDDCVKATDLTIIALAGAWGKRMYEGDCLKLTMKAEYVPENK